MDFDSRAHRFPDLGPATRFPRLRLSVRACLTLLVVLSTLPLLVLATWLMLTLGREQRDATQRGVDEASRALSGAVDRDLEETISTLEAFGALSSLADARLEDFHDEASRVVAARSDWRAITLTAPSGEPLVDTRLPYAAALGRVADRESFDRLLATRAPVVGSPTPDGLFAVRVPVPRVGPVRFVLSALVRASAMADVVAHQGLPDHWTAVLLDGRGAAIAQSRGGAAVFRGAPSYVAEARARLAPWSVVVAVPAEAVDRPLTRSMTAIVMGGLGLIVIGLSLAGLAGRLVTRSLRTLADAAADLARGRLPPPVRSRVSDLDRVGRDLEAAGAAREHAERAVRATEERFRVMADAAPVLVWMAGAERRCTWLNVQWLGFTGRSLEEELGAGWMERVHPEDVDLCREAYATAYAAWRPFRVDYRLRRRDGVYRWMRDEGVPLHGVDEPFSGYIGVCVDITDQKLAEIERTELLTREQAARREAEAASQTKDEFLAVLSHELRTPLNALRLWAAVLKSGGADEATRARAIRTIDRNAEIQAQMIEDLLDISRIASGGLRLNVQRLDLRPIVEAAIDTVRTAAENKGVRIVATLEPGTGAVLGDPMRLQQAAWNLLSNAVKFTPSGGCVDVDVRRAGIAVEISVADTGCGIAPDQLPHVFERFHQAPAGPTAAGPAPAAEARSHGGLGLGLTIARQLVELHGGTVTAHSDGEGKGATFVIRLPRAAASAGEGPVQAGPAPRSTATLDRVDILVVDDDADTRAAMLLALGRYGARVRTAASVPDALSLIEGERWPDVLISDIGMPEQDGYDLIRQLRSLELSRGGRIPAIALTAYASPADRKRALESGYQAHVAKPVDPAEVADLVVSLVARPR